MASSGKTSYHALNQWGAADKPKRADFNNDNLILDAALSPTMNQGTAPTSATQRGTVAAVVGWLANRIRAITGKTNWHENPAVTLEQCSTHINDTVHTPATASKAGSMSAADKGKLDGIGTGSQKNSDITKAEIEAKLTGTITTHTHGDYASCSTAAATVAKTATVSGFVLAVGNKVTLKFTNTNTATNPTLNINGTGAYPIIYMDFNMPTASLIAGGIYEFVWTGSFYEMLDGAATSYTAGKLSGADKAKLDNATALGTSGSLMLRDANGRAQVVNPSAAADIANKSYVDAHTHPAATASAIGFMSAADKQKLDCVFYGSCSTAAGTAAKTVAVTGFVRFTGAKVTVKFTTANTAANPTLNVNSTGAADIFYRGAAVTPGFIQANGLYDFVFNGTQWEMTDGIAASDRYGDVIYADNTDTTDRVSAIPYRYINSIETVDLNDYRVPSEWTFYSITLSALNFPAGTWTGTSNSSYLEVRRFFSNTVMHQTLYKRGTNEIWTRYCTTATAWSAWEKLTTSGQNGLYASCSTAAATQTKTATITGFVRNVGNTVTVKFTNTNTATNPMLDINSTGAAYILYLGNYVPAANLQANGIYDFVWTGTYYEMLGASFALATQSANGLMSAADKIRIDNAVITNIAATMNAILTAQSNTSYTTKQVRNIVFWTSGTSPPTTANGDVIIKTF